LGGEFGCFRVWGEGVDITDCGVEGGVAFNAGDGVAFESFLIEEHVYDFICLMLGHLHINSTHSIPGTLEKGNSKFWSRGG
jgi:hypothetical protein